MRTRQAMTLVIAGAVLLCMAGCSGPFFRPPQSGYVDEGEVGIVVTPGLDDHDYDLAVAGISKAFREQGLPDKYVVALGPVDTRDCRYNVQVETLQKSMQTTLASCKGMRFTGAINAMGGANPGGEFYKIIEYNWNNRNPIDREDLQKFGKIANVGGLLFGRISCIEARARGLLQVDYRFVWELMDTATGEVMLSHEKKIRKVVGRR